MDKICCDCVQHVEDTCQMKVKVAQMRGKAVLKSHEAVSLWDLINVDHTVINQLISITTELTNYINQLGEIEVLRERLHLMDLWINKLQMRPSMHTLEDRLAALEDKMNEQHQEITIL